MSWDGSALPDYRVRCLSPELSQGGNEKLRFEVNGKVYTVSLKLRGFNRIMLQAMPDRALDLLEVASLVYGLDSVVSRGGLTDQHMGAKWYRRFLVTMPVRDLSAWLLEDVGELLSEALHALSGDRFEFTFVQMAGQSIESEWFDLGIEEAWRADRVLMFSGGLDSFAGALEEIADHGHKVALVSHQSSTKIEKVQVELAAYLRKRFGQSSCRHIPLKAQLTSNAHVEGTHRTRSFLFAAIGHVTAMAFGLKRVSFHENGVVSLNLPPVNAVVGTKATRTTHPKVLPRFSGFLSRLFRDEIRVDNPFFWRTKTDVMHTIARLGGADQIAFTSSCADTHNRSIQHPHCGRCSQCIDRRFAMLASELEAHDPEEAYAVDLVRGEREDVRDRELGLSYMRNAVVFAHMTPDKLIARWPQVISAIDHLDQPRQSALTNLCDLLNRHGSSVKAVMERASKCADLPADSLPRLFGEMISEPLMSETTVSKHDVEPLGLTMSIDDGREWVRFAPDIVMKRSAVARLLIALARRHLEGAGQGLDPLDYPCFHPMDLAEVLGLQDDQGVRQAVKRVRQTIKKRMISAGYEEDATEIIENIPGQGYRLDPERVIVRKQGH